jgi:hypothetical protein
LDGGTLNVGTRGNRINEVVIAGNSDFTCGELVLNDTLKTANFTADNNSTVTIGDDFVSTNRIGRLKADDFTSGTYSQYKLNKNLFFNSFLD